ncbi:nascent polypeptide-associated complex subunit alpha, muscle-specific form-like [Frankliniella occidentalis]|uniref:Nascent polypeptide-associated complex subunit alpha, muscle-specific form-like n=1 Tax=Frankliniella occidentalis TaxID=133901 RepID=A0A9C6XS49_FRAOC|nr:nascent polypeptide-associated complex subunit alpha, muscle-specific form-like [Frankliniella occidentalis]
MRGASRSPVMTVTPLRPADITNTTNSNTAWGGRKPWGARQPPAAIQQQSFQRTLPARSPGRSPASPASSCSTAPFFITPAPSRDTTLRHPEGYQRGLPTSYPQSAPYPQGRAYGPPQRTPATTMQDTTHPRGGTTTTPLSSPAAYPQGRTFGPPQRSPASTVQDAPRTRGGTTAPLPSPATPRGGGYSPLPHHYVPATAPQRATPTYAPGPRAPTASRGPTPPRPAPGPSVAAPVIPDHIRRNSVQQAAPAPSPLAPKPSSWLPPPRVAGGAQSTAPTRGPTGALPAAPSRGPIGGPSTVPSVPPRGPIGALPAPPSRGPMGAQPAAPSRVPGTYPDQAGPPGLGSETRLTPVVKVISQRLVASSLLFPTVESA